MKIFKVQNNLLKKLQNKRVLIGVDFRKSINGKYIISDNIKVLKKNRK